MTTRTSLIAILGIAATLALSGVALAQQSGTISNRELLARIEQLEAQLQANGGPMCDDACAPSCGSCCDCTCGAYFVYENVIVKPHFTRDSAYTIVDPNGIDGYEEHSFNWDYGYSGRIELGYLPTCDCIGVRARYWRFDDNTRLNAFDPNGDIHAGFGEDGVQIGLDRVTSATFTRSLEMDVVDLEVAVRNCNWIYSGGIRYANMEQTYNGFDNNNANDLFFSGHDFEGLGLTTAIEASYGFGNNWSVFAKTRGSLLYGGTEFFALDPIDRELFRQRNDNDIIASAELQVGLDWRTCLCSGQIVFATIACETQYWINAGTGSSTSNAPFDELNYQNGHAQDADLGFVGLNIGLGMIF